MQHSTFTNLPIRTLSVSGHVHTYLQVFALYICKATTFVRHNGHDEFHTQQDKIMPEHTLQKYSHLVPTQQKAYHVMCLKMNWFFPNKFCENITIHYIIQDSHRTLTFNPGKSNLSSYSSLQSLHYGRVICITLAKLKHLSSAKD